jgi:glycosyltransferase involved in cell wall biosynthesis
MKILGFKTHAIGTDGKVRLSSVDWWRIMNPYTQVAKKKGWDIEFKIKAHDEKEEPEEMWDKIGRENDIIVTSYIDTPKAYAYLRATCQKYKRKLVMDLDDNVYEVDEMNPAYIRYHPNSEALKVVDSILKDVPILTTSTRHLAKIVVLRRQKAVYVLENYIDKDKYIYKPELIPDNGEKIIIGYQGSSTHYNDLMLTNILHVLRRICIKYTQVRCHFIGCIIDEIENYIPKKQLIMTGGERDHDNWIKLWQKLDFDIGIAPLLDTSFNRAKSSIKYYEYALRKIPAVYSFIEPYSTKVQENHTGFLARDEEEWFEKLSWLVENKILRKKMGDVSRKDVLDNYTIQKHWKKWLELLS